MVMYKRTFLFALAAIFAFSGVYAQKLSDNERKLAIEDINENIKKISQIRYDAPELLAVYNSQLSEAEEVVRKYQDYRDDVQVFERWYALSSLTEQNREIIDFLTPKMVELTYRQGLASLENKDLDKALILFNKTLKHNSKHVMANYQLAKIDLDSMKLAKGFERLSNIIRNMSPDVNQKELVLNLMHYTYGKNYLYAMSLANQGKHARAMEVLSELEKYCDVDSLEICEGQNLQQAISQSKSQIYSDHLKLAKKSLSAGRNAVAETFAVIAYEYYSENKGSVDPNTDFQQLIKQIAQNYINEAKELEGDRKAALYQEYLDKARELSKYTDEDVRNNLEAQIAKLEPAKTKYEEKNEAIEKNAVDTSYAEKYSDFVADVDEEKTPEQVQEEVDKVEKTYVNEKTKKVAKTKQPISKALDDKFYETRALLSVNSFEKAMEVLESANQLAKIEGEKSELDNMYHTAIREITAKRMSAAEYAIWQGDANTADSLVTLTNALIKSYNMEKDTAIVRIMNSYLNALDQKVCSKRQDELNSYVYSILDCIKRNDYYKAEAYVRQALAVPESRKCRLDKSKLKALMKQIEKPLEYIDRLDEAYKSLKAGDTNSYIQQYGALETMYNMYELENSNIKHTPLRQILVNLDDVDLTLNAIEILVRYKEFMVSLEALGALKDMEYKASETKNVQQRLGKLMSYEMNKQNYSYEDAMDAITYYTTDKWYKYFTKQFKKSMKVWIKESR